MKRILFQILFWMGISFPLASIEYGLFAKKEGQTSITKLAVFSERCSGSNFIENLILTNFEGISPVSFSHKHFCPWFVLPPEHYKGNPRHYDFKKTEDHLFVVIFRNPYDWAQSVQKVPWHADPSLKLRPFKQFIRSPWSLDAADPLVKLLGPSNPYMDRNPLDGSPFKNIFELRTAKIKNLLLIKERAKNVYYLNYEIARDHPQEVLKEIELLYSLNPTPSFHPVTSYKGLNKKVYKKRNYKLIDKVDLIFINSQLDEALEKEIGYSLISVE